LKKNEEAAELAGEKKIVCRKKARCSSNGLRYFSRKACGLREKNRSRGAGGGFKDEMPGKAKRERLQNTRSGGAPGNGHRERTTRE